MKKLHYSKRIQAPKDKVWDTMLQDSTFRAWTEPFSEGSHFLGDWSEGSKMLFLAPDKEGKESGMVSRVRQNRPKEYVSLEHLGMVQSGVEDTTSEAVKGWAGAREDYTFKESGGATEVLVDLDAEDSFMGMMEDAWPKALERLKELAEK